MYTLLIEYCHKYITEITCLMFLNRALRAVVINIKIINAFGAVLMSNHNYICRYNIIL